MPGASDVRFSAGATGGVATVSVSVNRTGTLAEPAPVTIYNYLPEVQRCVPVLAGTGGRIHVDGALASLYSQLLATHSLYVTGVSGFTASYRDDPRFLGTARPRPDRRSPIPARDPGLAPRLLPVSRWWRAQATTRSSGPMAAATPE